MRKAILRIVCAFAFASLSACGGGGGGKGNAAPTTFAVGVTVAGLAGTGLVLRNNGADSLTVTTNGSVSFTTRLQAGASYSIAVATQPLTPSQTCVVANPSGAVTNADVSGVSVTCTTNKFVIGGTISGLSGTAVLQNNGGDDKALGTNGAFAFDSAIDSGAAYSIAVLTQPDSPPQRCLVDGGLGTVGNGPVTSVAVQCETQYARFAYTLNSGDTSVSMYNVDTATGQLRARGYVKTGALPLDLATTSDGKYRYVFNAGSASISAYVRDAVTGDLAAITGSPFATGASASTSGSIALHPNNRFLYVANGSGGNSVSAFSMDASGALTAVAGSPFASGTAPTRVTVHPSGRFAYVSNATSKDIYTFGINADTGALAEVADSRTAAGIDPNNFTLHPNGRFAYVPNAGAGSLTAYAIDQATGKLAATANGVVAIGITPQGKIVFHPTGRYLYINGNGVNGGAVAAFSIASSTGALTAIAGSPYVTGVSAESFALDPAGKLLYAATRSSTTTGSIAMFRIDANSGALVVLGSSINLQPGPSSVSVDPGGKFVYASSTSSNQLYSFSIDATTGALIALARAPVMRTGDRPVSVAVESSKGRATPAVFASKFVYVANFANNSVSQYLVNAQTGLLGEIGPAFATGLGPRALAADIDGIELFGTMQTDSSVAAFDINTTSGALSLPTPGIAAFPAPVAIAVDAGRHFVFVANSQTNTVSSYRFDRTTRALAATGSVANTVEAPVAVTVDPTGRVLYFVTDTTVGHAIIDAATGAMVTGSSVTVEAGATAIAVDPTARFAYVAIGTNPGVLRAFSISAAAAPALGTLTPIGTAATGAIPRAVAIDPTGRFAYTADSAGNSVSAFVINQTSGALTAIGAAAAGTSPLALSVDYSGKFVYATNSIANSVSVFAINTATGSLVAVGTVPTGNSPIAIAVAGEVR